MIDNIIESLEKLQVQLRLEDFSQVVARSDRYIYACKCGSRNFKLTEFEGIRCNECDQEADYETT